MHKHSRIMLAVILLLSCIVPLRGNDDPAGNDNKYMVFFDTDKKTIYTDMLGMPGHTLVTDVLHIMPELINRGDLTYDKFDLQYDGKSIGESRDVILSQMRIADVEKIEISTSALSTHANNGQSGSINIVPRQKKEGLHGMAFIEGDLFWGIMPGVNLTYKRKKMELGALVNIEGQNSSNQRSYAEQNALQNIITNNSTEDNYFQQTAKLDFHYTFSPKDEIKAWFVESSGDYSIKTISDKTTTTDMSDILGPGMAMVDKGIDTTFTRTREMILEMNTEYQHYFDKDSKLTINADWSTKSEDGYVMKNAPYKINTAAKLKYRLCGNDVRNLTIKTGINANYDRFSSQLSNGYGLFISPSAELQYRQKSLSVDAAIQYQYYDRSFQVSDSSEDFSSRDHDFTSYLNLVWSMAKDHAIKFNASRNIIRPSEQMLYPGMNYYPSVRSWIKGNPKLNNAYIHSLELNYINECSIREHMMILNVGAGYDMARGVHQASTCYQSEQPMTYTVYNNNGKGNTIKGNLMLVYKYHAMTLSFAGNVFFNSDKNAVIKRPFYNLSISPVFNFNGRWTLTGRILYNSAIHREDAVLGDCLFTQAKISKDIKKWTLSLILNDITGFQTTDYHTSADKASISSGYNLYKRYVGLHVSKRFN